MRESRQMTLRGVARVRVDIDEVPSGSAVHLGGGRWLTARHVLGSSKQVELEWNTSDDPTDERLLGKAFVRPCELLPTDVERLAKRDLALLELKSPIPDDLLPPPVFVTCLHPWSRLTMRGFPRGRRGLTQLSGRVGGRRDGYRLQFLTSHEADAEHGLRGLSGGGVFDARNRLVGITVEGTIKNKKELWVVPLDDWPDLQPHEIWIPPSPVEALTTRLYDKVADLPRKPTVALKATFLIAVVVAGIVATILAPCLQPKEKAYHQWVLQQCPVFPNPNIVMVTVREEDLLALSPHPDGRPSRKKYAEFIDVLRQGPCPPVGLMIDLPFTEKGDNEENKKLGTSIRKCTEFLITLAYPEPVQVLEEPQPKQKFASIDLTSEGDYTVGAEVVPLDSSSRIRGACFALKQLLQQLHLDHDDYEPRISSHTLVLRDRDITLTLGVKDEIRPQWLRLHGHFMRKSLKDLLAHPQDARELSGKTILLGLETADDVHRVPSRSSPHGVEMYGVEIHADILNELMRYLTPCLSDGAKFLWLLVVAWMAALRIVMFGRLAARRGRLPRNGGTETPDHGAAISGKPLDSQRPSEPDGASASQQILPRIWCGIQWLSPFILALAIPWFAQVIPVPPWLQRFLTWAHATVSPLDTPNWTGTWVDTWGPIACVALASLLGLAFVSVWRPEEQSPSTPPANKTAEVEPGLGGLES